MVSFHHYVKCLAILVFDEVDTIADYDEETSSKRLCIPLPTTQSTDDLDSEDEEDMMLYGESTKIHEQNNNTDTEQSIPSSATTTQIFPDYNMQVVDSLPSTGQATGIDLGIERNNSEIDVPDKEELVISGGYMQNGSISILHQGLRPIVSTEAELEGCRAMWTVSGNIELDNTTSSYHSYLILSIGQRTMVLRTGEGMEPIEEECGFYTSGPTLCASNILSGKRIIQVQQK